MTSLYITQRGQGRPLVLLHGWGFHGGIWDTLALPPGWQAWQVDLPGHGRSAWTGQTRAEAIQALVAQLPSQAVWLGWSLGGTLALAAATQAQAAALVLIAATPKFVQDIDWPHALSAQVLADFGTRLHADYAATLQRFLALQVKGSEDAGRQLRALKTQLFALPPQPPALASGLTWLADSDERAALAALTCPALLLHGAYDALVPAGVGADCRVLYPALRTVCLDKAGHIPFLSHPTLFSSALSEFLYDLALPTD
jgi:pimeloyl-[acyl-carrier protein] methyl ester esterase